MIVPITTRSRNLGYGWTNAVVQDGDRLRIAREQITCDAQGGLATVERERANALRVNSGNDWMGTMFVGGRPINEVLDPAYLRGAGEIIEHLRLNGGEVLVKVQDTCARHRCDGEAVAEVLYKNATHTIERLCQKHLGYMYDALDHGACPPVTVTPLTSLTLFRTEALPRHYVAEDVDGWRWLIPVDPISPAAWYMRKPYHGNYVLEMVPGFIAKYYQPPVKERVQ